MINSNQGRHSKPSTLSVMLSIAIVLGFLAWGMVSTAHDGNTPHNRAHAFQYDYNEQYSVFCAYRAESVSCMYIPRDAVREEP